LCPSGSTRTGDRGIHDLANVAAAEMLEKKALR